MKRLIEHVTIWDGADRVIDDGGILIDGESIEAVLTNDSLSSIEPDPSVDRIDGSGRLAIPGLTNAHTHLYSSLARGMALPGFAPKTFTQILEQLWWRLDKALDRETIRSSALVGAMEAARCGVTTLIDHHASPGAVEGSLSSLKEAVCDEVGLRASFCYEVSDRDGLAVAERGIAENMRFLTQSMDGDGLCSGLMGLHASFTLSDETLDKVADRIPDGVGVHIHVAEGPEDEKLCISKHGLRIVERLDKFGLLRPTSVLAHCLHVDARERDMIADHGSLVVHNPRSNLNNAVGTFDLQDFVGRGIVTGLGTDGMGANMLSELFTAGLAQRARSGDPLAAPVPVLSSVLFKGNPLIAERILGVRIGKIAEGYPADVALVEYEPPTPLSTETVLGHLLFGISTNALHVSDLFVAGREIIGGGEFSEIDRGAVYAHAREQAARLWNSAA